MNVQTISDLQGRLSLFPLSENYDLFYSRFLQSNLDKIYSSIPWDDLVAFLGLKEKVFGRQQLFNLEVVLH